MIIYLIGFMGSGKSTAGRKLAAGLGFKFIDLDEMIENEMGKSIGEIFKKEGEDTFRNMEAIILRRTVKMEDTVIACGGGTPCFKENMEFMNRSGLTVYLEMSPGQLAGRLSGSREDRPLIKSLKEDELLNYIKKTLAEREKYYRKSIIAIRGFDLDIHALVKSVKQYINV